MKVDILQLKNLQKKVKRGLELEKNKLKEEEEQLMKFKRVFDLVDELCAENESLKKQLADKQAEIDNLKVQFHQKCIKNE
jgi:uncharacterized membrane-anchored protein YhcB (DUF1043 family)